MSRRVAVTGMGLLSPGGLGLDAYHRWQAQEHAARRLEQFDPQTYIPNAKLLRSMHRTFHIAAAAAVTAMRASALPDTAALDSAGIAAERAGIAAAFADLSPVTPDLLRVLAALPDPVAGELDWAQFAERGVHELHPFRRLTLLANMAAAHVSLLFNFQGPSFTFTSGVDAGVQALAEAFWTIADGHADLMVCEAADSPEQTFLSEPPAELGAAVVLESWETAVSRRARVLAEIATGDGAAPACPLPLAIAYVPETVSRWRPPTCSLVAALATIAAAGGEAGTGPGPLLEAPLIPLARLVSLESGVAPEMAVRVAS